MPCEEQADTAAHSEGTELQAVSQGVDEGKDASAQGHATNSRAAAAATVPVDDTGREGPSQPACVAPDGLSAQPDHHHGLEARAMAMPDLAAPASTSAPPDGVDQPACLDLDISSSASTSEQSTAALQGGESAPRMLEVPGSVPSSGADDATTSASSTASMSEDTFTATVQPTKPTAEALQRAAQQQWDTIQPPEDAAAQFFSDLQDVVGAVAREAADAARFASKATQPSTTSHTRHQRPARASVDRLRPQRAGQQYVPAGSPSQLSTASTLARQVHQAPAAASAKPSLGPGLAPTLSPARASNADWSAPAGSSRASSALLVRPVPLPRISSPHHQWRAPAGQIFSPSDSPPLTPPDSPQGRRGQALRQPAGAGSAGGATRPARQQQAASRQSLRALPSSAYRRRRTPVDELLARFNVTKYVGQYIKEGGGLAHAHDPRLQDLELAAERLQREGNATVPRRRPQSGRTSVQGERRGGSACGADDSGSAFGPEQTWVDGELLGSPPEWASEMSSSRPESARVHGRMMHQDSGDGRHQGMTGLSAYQGLATHMQGAYLTFPEYSFGGCRPIKGSPERGAPFERYGHKEEPASAVQQFYLRPDRSVVIAMQQLVEKQQQQVQEINLGGGGGGGLHAEKPPRQARQTSPPRVLPNGIPVSRIELQKSAQDQSRARLAGAYRKSAGPLKPGTANPEQAGLLASQSIMAESSTILTMQDAHAPPYQEQRSFSRTLSSMHSMPRQLSTLPAELEAAASTAVDLGLTALQTAPGTAEPVLDPHFFASMKAHFNQLAEDQTLRLQGKLNTGLPVILKQFGVKHVNALASGGTGRRTGRPQPEA